MFNNINDIKKIISEVFQCDMSEILNIKPQKSGMTNSSYLFELNNIKYQIRFPGDGSNKLIDRRKEYEVYNAIKNMGISDDIEFINPNNGIKISRFIENCHNCSIDSEKDIELAMKKLRELHSYRLTVNHSFNIFDQIEYYERLINKNSKYKDYFQVKSKIFSLKKYLSENSKKPILSHIDSVCDNFLIKDDKVTLIDWEYSAMHDPDIDIAMFCLYSQLNKEECDRIIDIYYESECDLTTKTNIYCYIAAGGLLWSNWCEYKEIFGNNFGDYALSQYEYAKNFYHYALELIPDKYKLHVDNAVIMAAGASSRFAPISHEKPKGLLNVKGDILIERLINQLKDAGIDNIIVVTGFMADKFQYLKEKFGVKLINNPAYIIKNNYSSLYAVKDYLKNSYVCCADNYYTKNIFNDVELQPYYASTYAIGETEEWCIDFNTDKLITNVTVGGHDSWIMMGHALFDEKFSTKLLEHIENIYNDDSYNSLLWEYIYLYNMKNLDLYARTYDDDVIYEFDSLDELRQFDIKYTYDSGSKILNELKIKHQCKESDIINIQTIKDKTNEAIGFTYDIFGNTYTYLYNSEEE